MQVNSNSFYRYNRDIGFNKANYELSKMPKHKTTAERQAEKESSELWKEAFQQYWDEHFDSFNEANMMYILMLGKDAEDFADKVISNKKV